MHQGQAGTVVEPFFLPVAPGHRFCLFRGPAAGVPCRGAFVHVPAFGEEMNKSRRMAALQSRMLAQHGFATLNVDLFGTGDSDGDFRDASWETWLTDVVAACQWLERRVNCTVGLWGLRLGALIAAQVLHDRLVQASALVVWQPVCNGHSFLTQFLRLDLASQMMMGNSTTTDTRALRELLRDGNSLEIAGYELSPALANALDASRLADLAPRGVRCTWLEVAMEAGSEPSPASRKVISAWRDDGIDVDVRLTVGEPFWSTVEIVENAALLDSTLIAIADVA